MARLRGWAPRGERLVDKVPQGLWKTATFLAALRNDRIDAPCLYDGPINGERFRAYVEQFLAPTLKLDTSNNRFLARLSGAVVASVGFEGRCEDFPAPIEAGAAGLLPVSSRGGVFRPQPGEAADVVGQIGEADFHPRPCDADCSDEEAHRALLAREHMLDGAAHF